jgi:two-component system, NarL family, response regulator DevR
MDLVDDALQHGRQFEVGTEGDDGVNEFAEGSGPGELRHGRILAVRSGGMAGREEARMASMTTKVFLLDDHEIVRRGLRDLLEAEDDLTVVGEAGTAEQALNRIPATQPDVAVLDVRLGGDTESGIEVCREVRSQHPEVRCIMLTSFADDEALFAAIMAGASGYILKQVRGSDLVDAIRRVGRGESLIDPALTGRLLERLRTKPEQEDELAGLSDQERKILDLIAEGYTNRQIAETIFLAEKTVKNYVSNLLAKLGMSRRTEAAAYAARLTERRKQEPH